MTFARGLLYNFLQSMMANPSDPSHRLPLVLAVQEGVGGARDSFKILSGREKQISPFSEYLFDYFKTKLEDIFFIGDEYEAIFDRFEIMFSLQHAHELEKITPGHMWGPIGRFGWKYGRGAVLNPFNLMCDEAAHAKTSWNPLKSGFFDGSYERFEMIVSQYAERLQHIY